MVSFEGIWTLGLWIRKAVECFKFCLMGHSSWSMEDIGAGGDLNCGGLTQKDSEEKNVSMLPRDHSCDILVKKVAAFCSCLKILMKLK